MDCYKSNIDYSKSNMGYLKILIIINRQNGSFKVKSGLLKVRYGLFKNWIIINPQVWVIKSEIGIIKNQ